MVALTTTSPPTVFRTVSEIQEDLVKDLLALTGSAHSYPDASVSFTRPAILRRLAVIIADRVDAGTDRLVALERDGALAVAVSLHTGVPFALVGDNVTGEIYAGENAMFLTYLLDDKAIKEFTVATAEHELQSAGTLAIFGTVNPRDADETHVLLEHFPSVESVVEK